MADITQLNVRTEFSDVRGLFDALNRLERQSGRTKSSLDRIDRAASGLNRTMRALGVGLSIEAARRGTVRLFELGAAVEETGSKYRTVFGPAVDGVNGFLDEFAIKAGLSRTEAEGLTASAGGLAQGMGFTQQQSAGLSETIVRLSADLASFNNLQGGAEDATQRIISALTGETESLKQLNIVLRQEEVTQRALLDSGKTLVSQITQQERATASLALISEKAGVAVGDLDRTQDSAANQARRLGAQFRDLRDVLGRELLPLFLDVISSLNSQGEAFDNVEDEIRDAVRFLRRFILEGDKLFIGIDASILRMTIRFRNFLGLDTTNLRNDLGALEERLSQVAEKLRELGESPLGGDSFSPTTLPEIGGGAGGDRASRELVASLNEQVAAQERVLAATRQSEQAGERMARRVEIEAAIRDELADATAEHADEIEALIRKLGRLEDATERAAEAQERAREAREDARERALVIESLEDEVQHQRALVNATRHSERQVEALRVSRAGWLAVQELGAQATQTEKAEAFALGKEYERLTIVLEKLEEAEERRREAAREAAEAAREAAASWLSAMQNLGRAIGGVTDQIVALAAASVKITDLGAFQFNPLGFATGATALLAGVFGGPGNAAYAQRDEQLERNTDAIRRLTEATENANVRSAENIASLRQLAGDVLIGAGGGTGSLTARTRVEDRLRLQAGAESLGFDLSGFNFRALEQFLVFLDTLAEKTAEAAAEEERLAAVRAQEAELARAISQRDFALEAGAGAARLRGDDRTALQLELQLQAERRMRTLQEELEAGNLLQETFDSLVATITGEVNAALVEFDQRAEEAAEAARLAAQAEAFRAAQDLQNLELRLLQAQGSSEAAAELRQLMELEQAYFDGRSQAYIDLLLLVQAEEDRQRQQQRQIAATQDFTRALERETNERLRGASVLNAPAGFRLGGATFQATAPVSQTFHISIDGSGLSKEELEAAVRDAFATTQRAGGSTVVIS